MQKAHEPLSENSFRKIKREYKALQFPIRSSRDCSWGVALDASLEAEVIALRVRIEEVGKIVAVRVRYKEFGEMASFDDLCEAAMLSMIYKSAFPECEGKQSSKAQDSDVNSCTLVLLKSDFFGHLGK